MQSGYPDVGQAIGLDPVRPQDRSALVSHGRICRPGRHHQDLFRPRLGSTPDDRPAGHGSRIVDGQRRLDLDLLGPREHHRPTTAGEEFGYDEGDLLSGLARPVDGLREALAQCPVVINACDADVGERKSLEQADGIVGLHPT
jgi:hypothetical protein